MPIREKKFKLPGLWVAWIAAILVLLSTAGLFLSALVRSHREVRDPALLSPSSTLSTLLSTKEPIFFSSDAYRWIPPVILPPTLPSSNEAAKASLNSSLWRSLHRQHHYSKVFLEGPEVLYAPLLRHLLDSPDWYLAEVNPWGFLFCEGNPESSLSWTLPTPETLQRRWPKGEERSRWLIGVAQRLMTLDRYREAEQALLLAKQSVASSTSLSALLEAQASLAALREHWSEAVSLSSESLRQDSSNLSARFTLIRALLETGRSDESLDMARQLITAHPKNPAALFLYARVANVSHANEEEVQALEQLITISKAATPPTATGVYEAYLGQAYAKLGRRSEALRALQASVAAPEITTKEREHLEQLISHLREGLPTASPQPSASPFSLSPAATP